MPSLMLDCRSCHAEFPSGIGVNEVALHGVTMAGLHHRCPHCGADDQYYTNDYHMAKAPVEAAPTPQESQAAEVAQQREEANRMAGFGVGA
jgi:hypothetical protein